MRNRIVSTWGATVVVMAACVTWAATDYYVSPNGSDASNNGLSWTSAWASISNAVAHAGNQDVVHVSNGLYEISAEIRILTAMTVVSVNGRDVTTVKRKAVGSAAPQHRVFYLNNAGAAVDGLTITNGYVGSGLYGGGVYIDSGGGIVRNGRVTGNYGYNRGGGVYIADAATSGLVSNCVVNGNSGYYQSGYGGGVYVGKGMVVNSLIQANIARQGGGVYFNQAGGTVRNCVISGNWVFYYGGGAAFDNYNQHGAVIENCTIADNQSKQWGGGIYHGSQGVAHMRNLIVSHNDAPVGPNHHGLLAGYSRLTHSCLTPLWPGAGNTDRDPEFLSPGTPGTYWDNINNIRSCVSGVYSLRPGSPCIDSGTNVTAWMDGAMDLDGTDRIVNGQVDIGAYEFVPRALSCNLVASTRAALAPASVVLTGYAAGTNLAGLTYYWDFGNGSPAVQGGDRQVVTNLYAAGTFSPSLSVSNSAGQGATQLRTDYVKTAPLNLHVSAKGTNHFPYSTWAAASTNIQTAVNAAVAGCTVWVTNGTYADSGWHVSIQDGITVRSMNGPAKTTINGEDKRRCVFLNHTNATVDGFTLTRGRGQGGPSPIYDGGGVFIWSGGRLLNCWVVTNNSYGFHYGGVRCWTGGYVRNCVISRNNGAGTGGIGNTFGLRMENCTVTHNTSGYPNVNNGSGMSCSDNAYVYNSIFANNTNSHTGGRGMPDIHDGFNFRSTRIYYSLCTQTQQVWASKGSNNISNHPPAFVDVANRDYRLTEHSAAVNTGTNLPWMLLAGATDLDGLPRIRRRTVDRGSFEWQPPAGTVVTLR